jgi:hypothetical protein
MAKLGSTLRIERGGVMEESGLICGCCHHTEHALQGGTDSWWNCTTQRPGWCLGSVAKRDCSVQTSECNAWHAMPMALCHAWWGCVGVTRCVQVNIRAHSGCMPPLLDLQVLSQVLSPPLNSEELLEEVCASYAYLNQHQRTTTSCCFVLVLFFCGGAG